MPRSLVIVGHNYIQFDDVLARHLRERHGWFARKDVFWSSPAAQDAIRARQIDAVIVTSSCEHDGVSAETFLEQVVIPSNVPFVVVDSEHLRGVPEEIRRQARARISFRDLMEGLNGWSNSPVFDEMLAPLH